MSEKTYVFDSAPNQTLDAATAALLAFPFLRMACFAYSTARELFPVIVVAPGVNCVPKTVTAEPFLAPF